MTPLIWTFVLSWPLFAWRCLFLFKSNKIYAPLLSRLTNNKEPYWRKNDQINTLPLWGGARLVGPVTPQPLHQPSLFNWVAANYYWEVRGVFPSPREQQPLRRQNWCLRYITGQGCGQLVGWRVSVVSGLCLKYPQLDMSTVPTSPVHFFSLLTVVCTPSTTTPSTSNTKYREQPSQAGSLTPPTPPSSLPSQLSLMS